MLYVERRPHPALAPYIRSFWYTYDPGAIHARERVLPAGHLQVVISLARDYLTDCSNDLQAPARPSAAAVLVGIHSRYQVIDSFDFAELIGIVFRPGGTIPFFPPVTDAFMNLETSLEDLWGRRAANLRERMQDAATVEGKFGVLEGALLRTLGEAGRVACSAAVRLALTELQRDRGTGSVVAEISRQSGLSSRRLSQVFREQIGVSPKLYHRILRFQRALQQLHHGAEIRWSELALECGYYDQSHFVNDFRAFSGISPTTYSATPRVWSNHVRPE